MADVQIAIIDQENTQIALAAPSETSVNIAVPGIQGVPGPGVPTGGTANQVLFKQSGTNYDTAWSTVTSAMIGDLQIADADVSATAAIAGTKIAPNFGSQTVQTTGVFSHALGTAAAPTVTFTGDPNTGLYSPGADQLAISTGGTGRLFVASDGNVGIGTSAPNRLLEVSAGSDNFIRVNVSSGAYKSGIEFAQGSTVYSQLYFNNVAPYDLSLLQQYSTGSLILGTNNTERLRITSDGKVGIGTSAPGEILDLSATTDPKIQFTDVGNVISKIGISGSTALTFEHNGSERFRCDASGRLLVGTSTTSNLAGLSGLTQLEGSSASTPGFIAWNNSNTAGYGSYLALGRSRGSTVGSNTAVQNNDDLGRIYFFGANGTDRSNWAAEILCSVDGDPFTAGDTTDLPGRLVFLTTPDGSSGAAERMRLNSQGELLIGTTTRTANGGVLQVSNGITFPGTQSACSDPNTLDDYEEGTFTPTVSGATTAGTGTYSIQVGRYTKVGNRVQFTVYMVWTGHTGTGAMRVSGLPFTSSTVANTLHAISIWQQNITLTAGTLMMGYVLNSNTQVGLSEIATGGGTQAPVAMDPSGDIIVTGVYGV